MIDASELPNATHCRQCAKIVPKCDLVLVSFLARDVPELLEGCHCSRTCFQMHMASACLCGHHFDGPDGYALGQEEARRAYILLYEPPLPTGPSWVWCLSDEPIDLG